MPIASGQEIYVIQHETVYARGLSWSASEIASALENEVAEIVHDAAGRELLKEAVAAVASTGFQDQQLQKLIASDSTPEPWRVGEGIAQAWLEAHRNCEFPWPGTRDQKNSNASPAGTDLVGLREMNSTHKFAFAEVKTSSDQNYPPSLMYGRTGLKKQMEDLRDSASVKDDLVRYLLRHSLNQPWFTNLQSALRSYAQDRANVTLFGVMVRDVDPHPSDLDARAKSLAKGRPPATDIELLGVYVPKKSIESFPVQCIKKTKAGS